ncbi:hypothetical protein ACFYNY_32845 [Streptomyces sp. NPDC006530]|uniref:hypothetical protein n=1 Tax=Streptomyces sp. NPDC006530 TaxID=3364750 RepID=UPI00368A1951
MSPLPRPVAPCLAHGATPARRFGTTETAVVIVIVVLSAGLTQTGMQEAAALRLPLTAALLGGWAVRLAAAGPPRALRLTGRAMARLAAQG